MIRSFIGIAAIAYSLVAAAATLYRPTVDQASSDHKTERLYSLEDVSGASRRFLTDQRRLDSHLRLPGRQQEQRAL